MFFAEPAHIMLVCDDCPRSLEIVTRSLAQCYDEALRLGWTIGPKKKMYNLAFTEKPGTCVCSKCYTKRYSKV